MRCASDGSAERPPQLAALLASDLADLWSAADLADLWPAADLVDLDLADVDADLCPAADLVDLDLADVDLVDDLWPVGEHLPVR